jgi:hypothetical protein
MISKALYLIGLFLVGCSASSLLAWLGTLHPNMFRVIGAAYGLIAAAWGVCWLCDDAIAPYFKAKNLNFYACLISFAVAIAIGGLCTWLTSN